jgi:hypothetical protein
VLEGVKDTGGSDSLERQMHNEFKLIHRTIYTTLLSELISKSRVSVIVSHSLSRSATALIVVAVLAVVAEM